MLVDRNRLQDFLTRLDSAFGHPGRVYLVGETTQVAEGWRRWSESIEVHTRIATPERERFDRLLGRLGRELGLEVIDEFPGNVIPLPDGYADRARPVSLEWRGTLELLHFDPYSVALRFIARGDEPDYHLVLEFLRRQWVTQDEMASLLEGLLPRFNERTIQQDPAEFRRKYHGLLQMWEAVRPGTVHRTTTA